MVKVTNNSNNEFVPVSSCVTSKLNGFQHQEKPPRSLSAFAKQPTPCNTSNDFSCLQPTSSKSVKENDHKEKANIFHKFSKNDGLFYSKSPSTSPEKQQYMCNAINGNCKPNYAPGSPKWTEIMKSRTCYSSPEQSPTKAFDSDPALFNISKKKSQPVLYRKMFGIFKENHEVLARWSDGLYYLGTIRQVYDYMLNI